MNNNKHPNLLNCLDYKLCQKEREIWILMDYVPQDLGTLFQKNKYNPHVMNEKFFKNIAFQILSGVNYLHENMIIHRDIKLENILYDESKNLVRIGDFGLSRPFDFDINSRYTDVGTCPYKPPELILGLTVYSTTFDIWSVGCVLVEICIGEHLFGDKTALGVLKLMYKIFGTFSEQKLPGYTKFPLSHMLKDIPETEGIGLVKYIQEKRKIDIKTYDFYDLIEKMLCINPINRISAKDCLAHSWFKEN